MRVTEAISTSLVRFGKVSYEKPLKMPRDVNPTPLRFVGPISGKLVYLTRRDKDTFTYYLQKEFPEYQQLKSIDGINRLLRDISFKKLSRLGKLGVAISGICFNLDHKLFIGSKSQ